MKKKLDTQFKPSNLSKIGWPLFIITFGLMLVMLSFDLVVSKDLENKQAKQATTNISYLAQGLIPPIFEKADLILQQSIRMYGKTVYSESPDTDLINRQLTDLMSNVLEAQPGSLRIANKEGIVIFDASDKEKTQPISLAEKHYFITHKDAKTTGFLVSDPVFSRLTGKWIIPVSRRFDNDDGTFGGIAQMFVRTEYIIQLFDKIILGDKSGVSLVAMNGDLIARSPRGSLVPEREYDLDAVLDLISKDALRGDIFTKSYLDQTMHRVSYAKITGIPLIVTAGISTADYLSDWNKKATYYGICLVFMLFVIALYRHTTVKLNFEDKQINELALKLKSATNDSLFSSKLLSVFTNEVHAIGEILTKHFFQRDPNVKPSENDWEVSRAAILRLNASSTNASLIAKIDANDQELNTSKNSVGDFLATIASDSHALTQKAKLDFIHNNAKTDITSMYVDGVLLQRMLLILIRHAIQSALPSSTIILKTNIKSTGAMTMLNVGINFVGEPKPSYVVNNLFSSLDHSETSLALSSDGIDLSLSAAAKIASLMNGKIIAESDETGKNVYQLTLPCGEKS